MRGNKWQRAARKSSAGDCRVPEISLLFYQYVLRLHTFAHLPCTAGEKGADLSINISGIQSQPREFIYEQLPFVVRKPHLELGVAVIAHRHLIRAWSRYTASCSCIIGQFGHKNQSTREAAREATNTPADMQDEGGISPCFFPGGLKSKCR